MSSTEQKATGPHNYSTEFEVSDIYNTYRTDRNILEAIKTVKKDILNLDIESKSQQATSIELKQLATKFKRNQLPFTENDHRRLLELLLEGINEQFFKDVIFYFYVHVTSITDPDTKRILRPYFYQKSISETKKNEYLNKTFGGISSLITEGKLEYFIESKDYIKTLCFHQVPIKDIRTPAYLKRLLDSIEAKKREYESEGVLPATNERINLQQEMQKITNKVPRKKTNKNKKIEKKKKNRKEEKEEKEEEEEDLEEDEEDEDIITFNDNSSDSSSSSTSINAAMMESKYKDSKREREETNDSSNSSSSSSETTNKRRRVEEQKENNSSSSSSSSTNNNTNVNTNNSNNNQVSSLMQRVANLERQVQYYYNQNIAVNQSYRELSLRMGMAEAQILSFFNR